MTDKKLAGPDASLEQVMDAVADMHVHSAAPGGDVPSALTVVAPLENGVLAGGSALSDVECWERGLPDSIDRAMAYEQLHDNQGVTLESEKPFAFKCCDCGLVHRVVIVSEDRRPVGFAVQRDEERTTAARAELATAHKWDATGERCVICGDKDWMAGPCSGASSDVDATNLQRLHDLLYAAQLAGADVTEARQILWRIRAERSASGAFPSDETTVSPARQEAEPDEQTPSRVSLQVSLPEGQDTSKGEQQ